MKTNTYDFTQGCFGEDWRSAPSIKESSSKQQTAGSENKASVFTSDREYDAYWEILG